MALSALNILSGIGAAAAGLAGEKVSKSGSIPGLDLAALVPALLGKAGGTGGIAGGLLSAVTKTGLLKESNLAGLAGSLFSFDSTAGTAKKTATEGVAGLAAAILGNSGTGTALGSIATLASTLAESAKGAKGLTGIASQLGKALSSSGVSFEGGATALKGLDKVLGGDIKGELIKAVLKGLA
jgi:hypothetical protein